MSAPRDDQRPNSSGWWTLAAVALAVVLLLPRMTTGALRQFDEASYAQSSREMLDRGDLLTVWWNGSPQFEKPPLAMWATAGVYCLFGESEFTARIFSAACGLSILALVSRLATKILPGTPAAGFIAPAALLCIPDFCRYATQGQLDVPLTLAITAQLVCFRLGLENPRWHWLGGFAFGLGIMTKGSAAGMGLVIQAAYILVARDRRCLQQWSWWGAIAAAVVVAAPWHLYQFGLHGDHFASDYARNTVLNRVGWTWVRPEFYIEFLLKKQQPWGSLIVVVVGLGSAVAWRVRDKQLTFAWCWAVAVPLLLSLLHSKWSRYLVPMYPGVALLTAYLVCSMPRFRRRRSLLVAGIALLAAVSNAEVLWRPANTDYENHLRTLRPVVRREVPAHAPVHVVQAGRGTSISPVAAVYYSERKVHTIDDVAHLASVVGGTDWMVHVFVHQAHLPAIRKAGLLSFDQQPARIDVLGRSGPVVLLRFASPSVVVDPPYRMLAE